MKKIIFTFFIIVGCLQLFSQITTINYTADYTTNFPNPERGVPQTVDPNWPHDENGNSIPWDSLPWSCYQNPELYDFTEWTDALSTRNLEDARAKGISLVMVRYHLAEFRTQDLSPEFLIRMQEDFDVVRNTGLKIVLHFVYNYPKGGPDAPLNWVLRHLDQLQPVIQNNVDVIAFMDVALIGCWGEQHDSFYNLVGDGSLGWTNLNSSSKLIFTKVAEVLPPQRMFITRFPWFKFQWFNGDNPDNQYLEAAPIAPVTSDEAYTQTLKARWGNEDDCLVCGEYNSGTWNGPRADATEMKTFLADENLYVVQSGETGNPDLTWTTDDDGDGYIAPEYDNCTRVTEMFETLHFSTFNYDFDPSVTERWVADGCDNEIRLKLGYRFRLLDATIPTSVNAGENLLMSFNVANDGWANPYNPRGLEIVLRNKETNDEYFITVTDGLSIPADHTLDPRFWQTGTTTTVNISNLVPSNIPSGNYYILLHLYDPETSIKTRPEYAIRLANENVWEETSGYNSLQATIIVDNTNGIETNNNSASYTISPNPLNTEIIITGNISEKTTYIITTELGVTIQTGTITNNTIYVSNLAAGLYILKIEIENKIFTNKFIKH